MKTYFVEEYKKGQVAYHGDELVGAIHLGPRGGQWGARGKLNPRYEVVKGNGKMETYVTFGTRNAKRYNAVIYRFFVYEGRLFASIIKKTSKWVHTYHWEVVPVNK